MESLKKQKLYESIEIKGINHKDTLAASEELDKEILKEMLKNPVTENIYLKQVIKAKDCEIKNLQNRINELTIQAQIEYEKGKSANDSINLIMRIAEREGIVGEIKINGIR
jgi:hypothetical protein